MEGENQSKKHQKPKGSVLQGDGNYFNKILSRESSVGQSSQKYYFRPPEGVPFKWEMQPGTPKWKAEEEIIPPPCPSPLMQSQGLPKIPSCLTDSPPPPGDYSRSREWLRKKFKKIQRSTSKLVQTSGLRKSNPRIGHSNREFSASNKSSSSSSSSSVSSFHGRSIEQHQEDGPPNCNPSWNMRGIMGSSQFQDNMNTNIQKKRTNKMMTKSTRKGGSFINKITPNCHVSKWSRIFIWMKRNKTVQDKGNVGQICLRTESTNLYPSYYDLRSVSLCKSISSSSTIYHSSRRSKSVWS